MMSAAIMSGWWAAHWPAAERLRPRCQPLTRQMTMSSPAEGRCILSASVAVQQLSALLLPAGKYSALSPSPLPPALEAPPAACKIAGAALSAVPVACIAISNVSCAALLTSRCVQQGAHAIYRREFRTTHWRPGSVQAEAPSDTTRPRGSPPAQPGHMLNPLTNHCGGLRGDATIWALLQNLCAARVQRWGLQHPSCLRTLRALSQRTLCMCVCIE